MGGDSTGCAGRQAGEVRATRTRGRALSRAGLLALILTLAGPLAPAVLAPIAPTAAHAQNMTEEEFSTAMTQLRQGTPEERAAAADLLGRRAYRQREQVAPVLRDLIRNDTDWRVRASAGRALGRLGTRDAVPDLVRALRDPVVDVRVVAAAAIWRLPDPAAVPALVELLRDQDASARQWAALALGVIRDVRAVQPLIAMLNDPEPAVRLDVIRSLGRIRDGSALAPLEQFARTDSHPTDERLEAVSSIATLQGPEKADSLVRLLESPSRDVRQRVIESLGQVGDALVIPALRRRRGSEVGAMRTAIDAAIQEIERRAREGTPAGGGGTASAPLPTP